MRRQSVSHVAEPRVVDAAILRSLEEYLDEVEAMGDVPEEVDADDHLIVFCREIYNQFFAGVTVLAFQLGEPGEASRIRVDTRRLSEGTNWPEHVSQVVHGYLKFCGLWADLFGLPYQDDSIGKLHYGFLPKMLDEFARWAHTERQSDLVRGLVALKQRHRRVVDEWKHRRDD